MNYFRHPFAFERFYLKCDALHEENQKKLDVNWTLVNYNLAINSRISINASRFILKILLGSLLLSCSAWLDGWLIVAKYYVAIFGLSLATSSNICPGILSLASYQLFETNRTYFREREYDPYSCDYDKSWATINEVLSQPKNQFIPTFDICHLSSILVYRCDLKLRMVTLHNFVISNTFQIPLV